MEALVLACPSLSSHIWDLWTGCLVSFESKVAWAPVPRLRHYFEGCGAFRRWGLTGLGRSHLPLVLIYNTLPELPPQRSFSHTLLPLWTSPCLPRSDELNSSWNHESEQTHCPLSHFCKVFYQGSKKSNAVIQSLSFHFSMCEWIGYCWFSGLSWGLEELDSQQQGRHTNKRKTWNIKQVLPSAVSTSSLLLGKTRHAVGVPQVEARRQKRRMRKRGRRKRKENLTYINF